MKEVKTRFGIIGTNTISDKIIAAAHEDNRFTLSAVYSRSMETAKAFAERHHIRHCFTSLEKMAASSLIDAVYIASPNLFHAQQSILFMKHGKHVLCEKPMASNVREAKAMIDASRKYGVTLMEAMMPTLKPGFAAIKTHLKKIDTVRHYFACYCQYSSRYDRLKQGIVENAFKPELANGAVADIGVYTIYPMVALFGRPNTINASGLLLSTGVDGQGVVNFGYDGMNATVIYSKIADSQLPAEIQGEAGTIIVDKINNIKSVSLELRNGETKEICQPSQKHDYFYEISEFINLVQNGRRESDVNSHINSLITVEIIDEIRRQVGVVFPADKE
ncbi:MAG: Gfo/Idh/MocA family oxidoreductase [Cytophagaceae bacterium]|jgi:predicted dehydrogenase|nr:Gfo/Idh/MocA family oxidoreductase [Cytophagaceae bacterium]